MLYLSKKKKKLTPLMLWQFFSLPGIENGIENRYFSRYRIEVRNSSIVTTLACRSYAQDLFTATRQEILDLRLHKTPRHVLNDLIEVLDLHRWFSLEKMKNVKYSELLSTIMMYTGNECIGCIGFFATFPLIHPDQVYPNSTNIRSIKLNYR